MVIALTSSFVSLGSINADFQFEVSADLSKGGTLPANTFTQRAGGKGLNRAMLAHNLGLCPLLIGRVGDDHFAGQALEPLRGTDLDLSGVSVSVESATGVSMIAVPENGEKTILLAGNANLDWDQSSLDALRQIIEGIAPDAVLTMDFEIAEEAIDVALHAATQRHLRIVADGSFGDAVKPEHLRKLYAIAPNVQEAGAITGSATASDADIETAARKLASSGVDIVCVKLSDGGCLLATGGTIEKIRAPHVEVVDKTGAGDAFTAALAIALLEGKSPRIAAIYGVAASSLAVTKKGSHEAYPTRPVLEEMARRVADGVSVA